MDSLFFILAKLIGLLIRGNSWIVLLFGLLLWAVWRGRLRLAKYLATFGFLTFFGLAVELCPKVGDAAFTQLRRIGGGMWSLRHKAHLWSVLLSGKPGAVQCPE
jgi:hypothetical protein